MRITNKHRLPTPMVAAVDFPFYYTDKRMGVTTLIDSPRVYQLRKRHDDELVEDAADRLFLLDGQADHYVLEKAGKKIEGIEVELKHTIEVAGWTVVCIGDLYDPKSKELSDYKRTSVWAVIDRKPKPEWEQQLNCNAAIYRENGLEVESLKIVARLRDWSVGKSKQGGNYPVIGVRVINVPVWHRAAAMAYIRERVELHQQAEKLPDNDLPFCTPLERYAQPDQWAVRKKTNKRATRLFPRKEEAFDYIAQKALEKDHVVDFRPGRSVRCEDYCPVVKFCNHAKELGVKV